jgi:hypothetical protein
MNSETKQNLILFFKNLADDIENDNLNEKQLRSSGEFCISYSIQNEIDSDQNIDMSEKDLIKFLFLGWYMYNIILKDNYSNNQIDNQL